MYRSLTCLLGLSALAGLLVLPGCGSEEKKDAPEVRVPTKNKGGGGGTKKAVLETATDGVIKGRVVLVGEAPKMASLAEQMQKSDDKAVCLSGAAFEKQEQTWMVGKDNGVANVVVRLVAPSGKKFKAIELESKEAEIDQPHCVYVPHIVAVKGGQGLKVNNSASVSHNTKAVGQAGENEDQNVLIPPKGSKVMVLNPQRDPVLLSCQIHPWMSAKVFVADHPYITVTDKDGNFELKNVPTGVELTIEGIHEAGKVDSAAVTVGAKETKTQDLKVSPK